MRDSFEKAISRDTFTEGGYSFLKRALKQNLDTKEPVIINSGDAYWSYNYSPGHKTFLDGCQIISGSEDSRAVAAFQEVAKSYLVEKGLKEIKNEASVWQKIKGLILG